MFNPRVDPSRRSVRDPNPVAWVGELGNWRARWVVAVKQGSSSDAVSTPEVARCWDSQHRPFVHECGFRPGERTRITGHSVWSHQPGRSRFHTGSRRAIRRLGSGDLRPGSRTARASTDGSSSGRFGTRQARAGGWPGRNEDGWRGCTRLSACRCSHGRSGCRCWRGGRFGTRRARAGGWPGRNGDGWRGCTRWSGCRCSHGRSGCPCWRGGTAGRGPCRPWWRGRSRRGRVRGAGHDRRPWALVHSREPPLFPEQYTGSPPHVITSRLQIGRCHRAGGPWLQDRRQPVPTTGRSRLGQLQLLRWGQFGTQQ